MKLKPCPFCGGEAKVKEEKGHWKIRCKNIDCDVRPTTSWFTVKEDAIDRWNRRKPLEDIVEQLEEKAADAGEWYNNYEDSYYEGKEDGIRDAVEIVEGGAV